MGKKGKRGGKAAKPGPGKARREKAAASRDIEIRSAALVEKLKGELKGKELFVPIKREDCEM